MDTKKQKFIQLYVLDELFKQLDNHVQLKDFDIDLKLDNKNTFVNKLKILQMIHKIHNKKLTPFITIFFHPTIEPMIIHISACKLLQFSLDNLDQLKEIKTIEGIKMDKQKIEKEIENLKTKLLQQMKNNPYQKIALEQIFGPLI